VRKTVTKEYYDSRSESIAWEIAVNKKGEPILDHKGRQLYQSIPVPRKGKNIIFCPYCNRYKDIETVDLGHGLKEKGCDNCGITMKDFHMKRVNQKG